MNKEIVPDTEHRGLISRLPYFPRDLAQLARFDRPIGWWLLFWPCLWGVWLTGSGFNWILVAWLLVGSIAMRGAGCVYNDIIDSELDKQVHRTSLRPIASGRISKKVAWLWLFALCGGGILVLLQLRLEAKLVALSSLGFIAVYPFMKRITWWPQVWLGIVFGWGLLVGWIALRSDNWDAILAIYVGTAFWIIGYDTIYALQDREDDALVGIKSSAIRLGSRVKGGIGLFYLCAVLFWLFGFWLYRPDWVALLTLFPVSIHLFWQVFSLDQSDPSSALDRFRSNRWAGGLMAIACLVVGNAGAL